MEEPKNKQDSEKSKNEVPQDDSDNVNQTKSDSDFYQRTFTGTHAIKSDENFDNTQRQSNEKDIEDRDNNDGDANTENNF